MTEQEARTIKAYLWGKHVPFDNAGIEVRESVIDGSFHVALINRGFSLIIHEYEAWEFFKRAWEAMP